MRTLFLYFIVFLSAMVDAQVSPVASTMDSIALKQKQDSIFSVLNVSKMAVFPGCEATSDDKLASIACFSDKLYQELIAHFDATYPETSIPKVRVETTLAFVSNLDGYITQIEAVKGDPEFYAQCIQALDTVAQSLFERGHQIAPAELADGTAVSLIFHIDMVLSNPAYKKEVMIYLYEQDCTVDEIYNRLPDYEIYHLKKPQIQAWIRRYESSLGDKTQMSDTP